MASLVTVDSSVRRLLRASLQQLPGVERVVLDEDTSTVGIICRHGSDREALAEAAMRVLDDAGVSLDDGSLQILTRADRPVRQRVRFIGAERFQEADAVVRVRVTLEWQGSEYVGEAVGERGDLIERRTAVLAALDAVDKIVPERLGLTLAGVKVQRAFDVDVILVSLYRAGSPPSRYSGAVLVHDDPLRAAAVSALNAINRLLGNFLEVR